MARRELRIPLEQARSLIYGSCGSFEVLSNELTGNRRWVNEYELIVHDQDGKLWLMCYDLPSTELQEGMDDADLFNADTDNMVTLVGVQPVQVTTTTYKVEEV